MTKHIFIAATIVFLTACNDRPSGRNEVIDGNIEDSIANDNNKDDASRRSAAATGSAFRSGTR
ncbi:MAG: hypothetical protein EOO04_35070, partial [Chitinophagaceae bacterium]